MALFYNIPFFSILLTLASAFFIPLLGNGGRALGLVRFVQLAVGLGSAWLLWIFRRLGMSFTFSMGHFPAPWGNELRRDLWRLYWL